MMTEIAQNQNNMNISKADHILINSRWVTMSWLPVVVAIIGITLSFAFGFMLYNNITVYIDLIIALQDLLPWIAILFGSSFAIVMAILIRAAQVTRRQAAHLKEANEALQVEMQSTELIRESKQKLEHALLQGQKLQAMGTLAGGIAHDFNNLLYAIIGYTEMARDDVPKDSQLHQNLGKILEACQRGRELVARILTFSRRQHHQLDVLNLKPAIEAVLGLLRQTIPASVTLDFKMDEEMHLNGNKTLLHQILVNIINNAVDAMDGEGTININVSRMSSKDPYMHQFPEMKANHYCKIMISDTGHGMDKETIERIFEPFYTTKEVGKGTGLGLSIVHSIVKEHQGEVAVTSQLGRGTVFTILLPEHEQTIRRENHG